MTNWKTSLWGILAAVPQVIQALGLVSNPKAVAIGQIASAVAVLGLANAAKDKDVTGTGANATREP